ncbi:hypothetical protein [Pseudomonas fontis]|uniref:Prophage PssSM-02 n=1 Tax=Pseudomonas fontis TaxID=2942633 RepID=A0ABT5NSA7_9PSED|nr:hypothetical protein [Pseudomonas fontis]MDD0974800.1 hypothetical protein [Pseudomonas fontis]MDD0991065.1 hypothetical protein [Pseudomonas fontis]
MLSSENLAELAAGICATAETLGQTISATAAKLMAEDLSVFPPKDIRKALQSCRRELTGKFTLGAIMQRIQAEDGRPGKDEAWAIAMTTNDEFETVVLTDEIQLALAAAKPILDGGDKIGARMAFIDAYQRFVGQSRDDAKPVNWHVSVGFDASRRVQAVTKAMELKRIPREHAQKYLADLSVVPVSEDGRAIAGLLTGAVTQPAPVLRKKLELVKNSMMEMRKASDERKLEMRIEAATSLADRRALLIKQAQELESRA